MYHPYMIATSFLHFRKKEIQHLAATCHIQLRRHNDYRREDCMRDPWGDEFLVGLDSMENPRMSQGDRRRLIGTSMVISRTDGQPAQILPRIQMERLEGWIDQFSAWYRENIPKAQTGGGPCGWATLMFTLFELGALNINDIAKFEDFLELLQNIRKIIEREQREDPIIKRLISISRGDVDMGTLPSGIYNAIRKNRLPCFKKLTAKNYVTQKCLDKYPVFKECAEEWKYTIIEDLPQLKPNERALEVVIDNGLIRPRLVADESTRETAEGD